MALIKQTFLGKPSGRVGDLVYRIVNGKLQVYAYKKGKVSNSEKSLFCREKQRFMAKMCSAINKIALIKNVWNVSSSKGSNAFLKLVSKNHRSDVNREDLTGVALIPNRSILGISINSISLTGNILSVEIIITGGAEQFDDIFLTEITAQGVMKLSDPVIEMPQVYEFIPLISTHTEYQPDQSMVFEIPIFGQHLNLFKAYATRRFALNLCLNDSLGFAQHFSNNAYGVI